MSNLELGKQRADELGLKMLDMITLTVTQRKWYKAYDIHKLLGDGAEVIGKKYQDTLHGFTNQKSIDWDQQKEPYTGCPQAALLIGIRPIKQDSCEQLVRDILRDANERGGHVLSDYIKRAKALLEEKE